jgi:signal transduction histidine kinase
MAKDQETDEMVDCLIHGGMEQWPYRKKIDAKALRLKGGLSDNGATMPVTPMENSPDALDGKFLLEVRRFRDNTLLRGFLEALSQPIMVLDKLHRMVWANQVLGKYTEVEVDAVLGKSPGEVLGCGECGGDSSRCRARTACGLRQALAAGFDGDGSSFDFHLERPGRDALALRLKCSPIGLFASDLLFLVVEDRSLQNRRDMLERVFFHDLINSLGAIQGASQMLEESAKGDDTEMAWLLAEQAQEVLNEVRSHRDLFDAETGDFRPRREKISGIKLLKRVAATFGVHQSFGGRTILLDASTQDILLYSDSTLLKRVLGNMVKNALEADKGPVTLKCSHWQDGILLEVHNEGVVPDESRDRIFRRAFSTKGQGRGLGCYSMKLFGEGILGGRVWYRSEQGLGTTFCIWLPVNLPQDV